MSDPRNAAHDKKVTQENTHHTSEVALEEAQAVPSGKAISPNESPAPKPPAALEASLVVLAKLEELEFHSRAAVERLAELTLTVEDELKQKAIVAPLGEVYSAQSAFQTKITTLIETYKAECDRMQSESA